MQPVKLLTLGALMSSSAITVSCADRATELNPQGPAVYMLHTRESFEIDFSVIAGFRELPDRTLLVSDSRERVLKIIFGTDSVNVIDRRGEGPGEFRRSPGALFSLRDDTTALNDAWGQRFLLLDGVRMLDRVEAGGGTVFPPNGVPIGADTLEAGHWYVQVPVLVAQLAEPGGDTRSIDSLVVVRVSRSLESVDTVARIGGGEVVSTRIEGAIRRRTVRPADSVIGFPDGWMAVAFQIPYSVAWRTPSGEWVRGSTLNVDGSSGNESVPAFFPTPWTLVGAPDGRLLVRRAAIKGSNTVRYDVIDHSGQLTAYFMLKQNEAVIGSGKTVLYISAEDSLGLARIRSVDWPR